jgi:hypothetical protein
MLVWQNKEARGDHLDRKKWVAGRPGASSEQVSASEECALQRLPTEEWRCCNVGLPSPPTPRSFSWEQDMHKEKGVDAALCCVQWRGCKIWECEEGEEERQSGEEEEERWCCNAGPQSPPTPRSFSWYPCLSLVQLHYRYPTCIVGLSFKSAIFYPNFFFII